MRCFILLLLFPTWSAAQIMPGQVIGFAQVDMNKDGFGERFVLVRDDEGGADLYIFNEASSEERIFIENFLEPSRSAPVMTALNPWDIDISVSSSDIDGSQIKSMLIEWDFDTGGYIVVGLGLTTPPSGAGEASFDCGMDFLVGEIRIRNGEKVVNREIGAAPPRLREPLPETLFELCYN